MRKGSGKIFLSLNMVRNQEEAKFVRIINLGGEEIYLRFTRRVRMKDGSKKL